MSRHLRITAAGALLVTTILAACVAGEDRGDFVADEIPEEDRYGGTVVIGGFGDLQSMNGLVSSDYNSNNIQRHMLFMTTVAYDEEIEPVPYLAERVDTAWVAGDSLELTFHIRRDVRWHDGEPTTARDVAFTYHRAVDPRTAFPNMTSFERYDPRGELVDDYTFRVRLEPHAEFMDIWTMLPIMPEHILGDVPPGQLLQHPFAYEPVGNGPFRFLRRIPGQEWVFEANPDFTEALGGRPYLDRIVYRYIPEMTTLLTELLTGRIDVYLGPNPNMADQIEAASGVELRASPFRQYDYIAWNTRLPMFSDARVRRALTMAIDRQQIVDALRHGYGEVGQSTVTPAHWSFTRDDPETLLPHDPEAAKKLLAEAGWTPGPDGILRDAEGRQFRFTMITNAGNDVRRDVMEIVQAQLRPLGIVVQPRQLEWTTLISTLQGRLDENGDRVRDFQAAVSGWVNFFRKDDTSILHCGNLNGPYQYVGYCNPKVDALLDTLVVTMDRDKAAPLWQQYQRLIVQESPYTVLYYHIRITGVRTRLQGAVMDIRGETVTAPEWWLPPGQR